MIRSIILWSVLMLVLFIQISVCMNGMQTLTSFSSLNPAVTSSLGRRYSFATNPDIGSLLMSGSKPGTQPTIVAIPLYIRNNLSKYPSILELLSTNSYQQIDPKMRKTSEIQANTSDGINSLKKIINDNIKQNDLASNYSIQRYRTQTQKSMKYNIREEQQKVLRQREQHKYDTEPKDQVDFSSPQKTQWSSQLINTPNHYLQSNEKTYSRPQQKFPKEEERKQILPEFESAFDTYSTNKFNDEQKSDDTDYRSVDTIKTNSEPLNKNHFQNYSPFGVSTEGKVIHRNRGNDKSNYGSQLSSYSSEIPEENFRYSDSDSRDDNQFIKNDNKYQNPDNNEYEITNKNNEFQYRSPPIYTRSYDRSIQSNQLTTPTNTYTPRPNIFRQNYENIYVTSKPSISSSFIPISSDEDSSHFQPMFSSKAYTSQSNPSNSGVDPQVNGYVVNPSAYSPETQSVSPNNNYVKTESKTQFTSNSNPNYSSDYSTPEDIDCYDDNSNDYKNTQFSIKSQNIRSEIYPKSNERDSYETEDLDPSKLDLKIVHLPVSLLKRLIGSGDIGLPSYQ